MVNPNPTQVKAATHRVDVTAHLATAMRAARVTGARGVELKSIPFVAQIGIRAELGSASAKALESVLGAKFPARVGEVASGKGRSILWLSPDEFLAVSDPSAGAVIDAADQVAALAAAMGDEPGSVIDLSANRVVLELAGPAAQLVLEKGCAYDLHPHYFTPGTAVQTAIGKVPVTIWKHAEDKFYVLPRASFADYLIKWLIDAMQEFASAEVK
jgi:sarcosine oxidase subunit gamma